MLKLTMLAILYAVGAIQLDRDQGHQDLLQQQSDTGTKQQAQSGCTLQMYKQPDFQGEPFTVTTTSETGQEFLNNGGMDDVSSVKSSGCSYVELYNDDAACRRNFKDNKKINHNADVAKLEYDLDDDICGVFIKKAVLSEPQIVMLKTLFNNVDQDGSKSVDLTEMTSFSKMCLPEALDPAVNVAAKTQMEEMDADKNDGVGINEWIKHFKKAYAGKTEDSVTEAIISLTGRFSKPVLSEPQIVMLKTLFNDVDQDGSKSVDLTEMTSFSKMCLPEALDPAVDDAARTQMETMDADGNDGVAMDEWIKHFKKVYAGKTEHSVTEAIKSLKGRFIKPVKPVLSEPQIVMLKMLFNDVDQDGSKSVDLTEMTSFSKMCLPEALDPAVDDAARTQMEKMDADGNDGVAMDEWIKHFKKVYAGKTEHSVTEAIKSLKGRFIKPVL